MVLSARLFPSVPKLPESIPASDLVLVGAIAGAFGVQGEVRLRSFTAEPDALVDYAPFFHADGKRALTPTSWRPVKDGIAVIAEEVKSREDAIAMRNTKLFVPRSALPPAEEDEFYHVDLIGLTVEALDGTPLGQVRSVIPGPQDLLDISDTPGAKSSWFLPFTKALVPVVDLAGKRLVAEVPAGLIPMIGEQPEIDPATTVQKPKAKPKSKIGKFAL
jgi:16S rRNA processing protein RimM